MKNKNNNKLLLFFLLTAVVLLSNSPAFANDVQINGGPQGVVKDVGGDLGGGGVAKLLELTPQEKAVLKAQLDKQAKFQQWLNGMDEAKEMRVLQKLYDLHVEPQLK